MTDTKHTPTHEMCLPLTYDGHYVYDADGNQVALHQHNSHIVKCVNMHDELVELLDRAVNGIWRHSDLDKAREALKKAGAL